MIDFCDLTFQTRQEAQTLLNQIAQTRNSMKEQEAVASAINDTPVVASNTVEMEVINIVSETPTTGDDNKTNPVDMGIKITQLAADPQTQATTSAGHNNNNEPNTNIRINTDHSDPESEFMSEFNIKRFSKKDH